jgi:arylsulfatase A-like enzyme
MIIHVPQQNTPRRSTELVSLVDVLPTLLELCGLPPLEGLQGRSFAAALNGDNPARPAQRFASGVKGRPNDRALFEDEFHLISTAGPAELFQFTVDPREKNNLAPVLADRLRAMGRTMLDYYSGLSRLPNFQPGTAPIPKDLEEQLRSLGYLQ